MTLKILIADDSATIQKIVTLAFGCEDAVVECASDGEAALDAMRRSKPDVVLADISMPGLGGYEVCARIKEDPDLTCIPVILLTGTFEPFDEMEAARVKCDGHLIKPFDTSELVDTVLSLAKSRATTQLSNTSVEAPVMDMQASNASSPVLPQQGLRAGVNPQVWDSYLGSDRILDLFDAEVVREAESMRSRTGRSTTIQAVKRIQEPRIPVPSTEALSEEALDLIVEKVMQRMSGDIIREIAWEVVPEMSENIIRRAIEEQNKP